MTSEERRLAWMWFDEDEEDAAEIASRLRRDPTTIRRFLTHDNINSRRKGRPRALGEQQIDRLVKLVNAEVQKAASMCVANTKYVITFVRHLAIRSRYAA